MQAPEPSPVIRAPDAFSTAPRTYLARIRCSLLNDLGLEDLKIESIKLEASSTELPSFPNNFKPQFPSTDKSRGFFLCGSDAVVARPL